MPVTLTFPPIGLRLTYPYSVGEMADAADSIRVKCTREG